MKIQQLDRFLNIATYLYLVLPYLVFFGGWIRQPYSTIFIVVLSIASLAGLRVANHRSDTEGSDAYVSWKSLLLMFIPVLVVTLVAGVGGWGFQEKDWLKHNAVLRDLVEEPWPVVYQIKGESLLLTYYVAFYMPAALIGKLLGWQAANHFLFIYTLGGISLAALWVWKLTGAKYWWFVLLFLAFSGMDLIGLAVATLYRESFDMDGVRALMTQLRTLEHQEWWTGWGFAQFTSNAALIVFVPNQAIPAWLLTSVILRDAKQGCLHETGIFYVGLSTLWAPFVTLGLIPFVVAIVIYQWAVDRFRGAMLRQAVSWTNLGGVLTGLIVVIYLAGRFQDFTIPIEMGNIYEEHITLTFLRQPNGFLRKYVLFLAFEFAILHVLLYWYFGVESKPQFASWRRLLMLSSLILVVLPVINWGWNNEPAMRTSIPALFITAIITLIVIADPSRTLQATWIKRAIWVVIIVGGMNNVSEVARHASGVYQQKAIVKVPQTEEVRTIFELQEEVYNGYYSFVGQYVGSAESYFVQYLGK